MNLLQEEGYSTLGMSTVVIVVNLLGRGPPLKKFFNGFLEVPIDDVPTRMKKGIDNPLGPATLSAFKLKTTLFVSSSEGMTQMISWSAGMIIDEMHSKFSLMKLRIFEEERMKELNS